MIITFALSSLALAPGTADRDIIAVAHEAGNFETLTNALRATELADALRGEGPFTIFAPTDEAFAKLPEEDLESLLEEENGDRLRSLLGYHIVAGDLRSNQFVERERTQVTTLAGQRIDVAGDGDTLTVDGARVVGADIVCSNGVIHAIDTVAVPVTQDLVAVLAGSGTFETLLAAVEAAGLTEMIAAKGPFTILAPTDGAFGQLPEGELDSLLEPENRERLIALVKRHVVPGRVYADQIASAGLVPSAGGGVVEVTVAGDDVLVGRAKILTADVEAGNGVVHAVGSVITM